MLIAVLFWLVNSLSKLYTTTVRIPVNYVNVPFSLEQDKPLPAAILVEIEGTGFHLFSNDFRKIKELIIDFNSPLFRNGDLNKHVSVSTLNVLKEFISISDSKYKIVNISPDSISCDYTKKFTIKSPVVLSAQIGFSKQFFQSSPPIIIPDSIEIAGSQNELSKIAFVKTQVVSFKAVNKNIFFNAKLLNPYGDKIVFSKDKVWVMVPVKEYTEVNLIVDIEKIYYQNKAVTLIPGKVKVTFRVPLNHFSTINKEDFHAEISAPDKSISLNEKKLKVIITHFPKSISLTSIEPELVDYLIEK